MISYTGLVHEAQARGPELNSPMDNTGPSRGPIVLQVPPTYSRDAFRIPPPKDRSNFHNSLFFNPYRYFDNHPPIVQVLGCSALSAAVISVAAGVAAKIYWTGNKFPSNIVNGLTIGHMQRYAMVGGLFGSIERLLCLARNNQLALSIKPCNGELKESILDYGVAGMLSGIFSGMYLGRPYLIAGHGFWFGLAACAWYMIKEDRDYDKGFMGNPTSWSINK